MASVIDEKLRKKLVGEVASAIQGLMTLRVMSLVGKVACPYDGVFPPAKVADGCQHQVRPAP